MARYPNGRIPRSALVFDRHGNPWLPGTYAKWVIFQRLVHERSGVWLYVTPKANGAYNTYRDYAGQVALRNWWASRGMPLMASLPGKSSHGGVWTGQTNGRYGMPRYVFQIDAGAFDVANWADVPWGVFEDAANKAGLRVNIVVPEERWHVVDPNPWTVPITATPAGQPATGSPAADPEPIEEDPMPTPEHKGYDVPQNVPEDRFAVCRVSGTKEKGERRFVNTQKGERGTAVFTIHTRGRIMVRAKFDFLNAIGRSKRTKTELAVEIDGRGQYVVQYDLGSKAQARLEVQALEPGAVIDRLDYTKNYWAR